MDQVLHFINEEPEAPTKCLAITTSPLNSLLSLSNRLSSILCHWNLIQDIIDTYHLPNPMTSPPHTWSLGSVWQSWPLPHYWHTLIYSVYETSHWFLYFFLNDCLPLQAPHLYVREPWISFGIFFSIYSHSLHNLF